MEEWLAERRIRAARMLKRFPALKEKLESSKLNLTLLELAQGFAHREKLSDAELWANLETIAGMSCRGAERELASRYPRSVEISKDRVRPLTAELSEVSFVASQELLDKLEDIRGLLAHSHPGIKLGELIDVLATEYRERHHPEEKAKRAEVRKARKNPGKIVESPTAPWAGAESEKRTPSQTMTHDTGEFRSGNLGRPRSMFGLDGNDRWVGGIFHAFSQAQVSVSVHAGVRKNTGQGFVAEIGKESIVELSQRVMGVRFFPSRWAFGARRSMLGWVGYAFIEKSHLP